MKHGGLPELGGSLPEGRWVDSFRTEVEDGRRGPESHRNAGGNGPSTPMLIRARLRPSFRAYARTLRTGGNTGVAVGFLAAAAAFTLAHPSALPADVGAVVLLFGSALFAAALYSFRASVAINDDTVLWHGIVRGGAFRRSEVASRVYGDFSSYGASNPLLILLNDAGDRLWILPLAYWGPEETGALLAYLDVPDIELWPKVSRAAVRARYPNAFKTPVRRLLRSAFRKVRPGA